MIGVVATLLLATPSFVDLEARDFEFAPTEVGVAPGAAVSWANVGKAPHSVTALDGSFQSEAQPGATATFTAPGDGVHPFVCAYHDWMKGNLTVDARLTRPMVSTRATPGPDAGFLAVLFVALAARRR